MRELRLDAEIGAGGRDRVAEGPERPGHPLPRVLEPAADDPLERMEPHLAARSRRRSCRRRRAGPRAAPRGRRPGADDPSAGVTSVAPSRLSQVRPYWAVRWPMPPPRVRPVTPVEPTTPPGVTRPWAWVAGRSRARWRRRRSGRSARSGSTSTVAHLGQVDHQAVVDRAVAGGVVASSPHRDLQVVLPAEGQRGGDVIGVDAAGDHRRAAVDQQVEAEPGPLVLGVAGSSTSPWSAS